ncbi:MAG: pyruvate kinase [Proteobacteria bacterium]|nr:pyruvate kinase [Pseudomonadota bacterium]MBU1610801.1 pyruvate kinase [Pseudomonadota bacterium]
MRTKIIATLGPGTQTKEAVKGLAEAGARIFRLNFSHGGKEFFEKLVKIIREVEAETGFVLTIMQDLSGPKIRTCDIGRGTIDAVKGTEVLLGVPGLEVEFKEPYICLDQAEIIKSLKVGEAVALSDGMLRFNVTERVDEYVVRMVAENSGMAPPRKGIAFPGKTTTLEAVTVKDKADLAIGMELGVDAVAISYVQRAEDIVGLKRLMDEHGRQLPIVAKLERPAAIQNLERIIEESSGIMVARGDLGLECDLATLPTLQKRIINACNAAGKPVIVATQMLLSMCNNPMPTRAETTDVANAILDGADCIMLSEETAIGKYPIETVQFMVKIGEAAEQYRFEDVYEGPRTPGDQAQPAKFLAYAACLLADKTRSKALVSHSTSGTTARTLSACRPRQPIYALSPDTRARHFSNLSWGVIPAIPDERIDSHQERAEKFVQDSPLFSEGDTVVVTAGQPTKNKLNKQTNVVKVYEK